LKNSPLERDKSMKKDKHGNQCNKLLPVNIFTLAAVQFDYAKAITYAE